MPVELAPFGVPILFGAVSVRGGGNSPLFTWLLTDSCGVRCSSSSSGLGLRTFVLHQG